MPAIPRELEAARPAGIRPSSVYVPEIESLRGVAITLVMLYHLDMLMAGGQERLLGTTVSPLSAFVHAGHTGVSLFFVLSAFLLSQPFLREAAGEAPVNRRNYCTRRALRILPLYWATVFTASVLCAPQPVAVLRGLPHLAFVDLAPGFANPLWPYSAVWWSLSTEVQFYVLLPLLPYAVRSRTGRLWGAALIVTYAAAYLAFAARYVTLPSVALQVWLTHSLFGRASLFALGIVAAWYSARYGLRAREWCAQRPWMRYGGADFALLATLLGLGCLLAWVTSVGYPRAESTYHVWHALEGALWTVCLLLLLHTPVRLKPLLSNPILRTVGTLSYSIYMVHYPFLDLSVNALQHSRFGPLLEWNTRTSAIAAFLAIGVLVLSTATYCTIERPFLVRKARIDR
ncbi:MAG: acyltransferase [Deltaproteobacteria bacterium]|nr:acyltransferase [Deltaproteobacteria bacterium]MBI3390790.1 acyltransferase [Deltaproteobacteria bacterium]